MSKEALFLKKLQKSLEQRFISEKYYRLFLGFYSSYKEALKETDISTETYVPYFDTFLELLKKEKENPFVFQPYHQKVRTPFDYYNFGLQLIKPLIDPISSSAKGLEFVDQMEQALSRKENVILFANHQTESDPLVISILLEKTYPDFAEKIIYVAGERVVSDPLAIPFSMGCDLLCIYSKKYLDVNPDLKMQKQLHNKKTMELMSKLLSEGGKVIYVAPSGGRDRPNAAGIVEVAPFDPQSIEMFYLMSKKAKTLTHFYPLSLVTYPLLPPPNSLQVEMGEERKASRGTLHLAFGKEISMENFPGCEESDKTVKKKNRALYIWSLVKKNYELLIQG